MFIRNLTRHLPRHLPRHLARPIRPLLTSFKRFYTLKQIMELQELEIKNPLITKPLHDESYRFFDECYEQLRDPTSTYSLIFNETFINKIDNIGMRADDSRPEVMLTHSKSVLSLLLKYYDLWRLLPKQFVIKNANTLKLLNSKIAGTYNDIYKYDEQIKSLRIKSQLEQVKNKINNDIDELIKL